MKVIYQRPFYDPFEVFQPSQALVKDCIRYLKSQSYELVRFKNLWKQEGLWFSGDIQWQKDLESKHQRLIYKIKDYEIKLRVFKKHGSYLANTSKNNYTDEDKFRAKQCPLENYVTERVRKSGRHLITKCPFHGEATGSFIIYLDQNTYHCYGCGANGDVIAFAMKLHNLTFKEALKFLLNN